jgi:hypothetical protein
MLKGRRALRSTAPENSPKPPENSLKSGFSTVWKKFFHCVENSRKVFPLCGKIGQIFSIVWKILQKLFHTVENLAAAYRQQYLRIPRRRPPDALRGRNGPFDPQNAFSAAPIFSLASRSGFCDKFGSSEMPCVRT